MMRFEDKVVIITGASSGIGEGVAKKFLEEGALVVGCLRCISRMNMRFMSRRT